ncbi:MAG: hypothetical protein COB81_06970 [Flavobacteriaceae bacterium]|nr:MAG: hypothetical protein COB81_06970 [Flavobacteriaceae bacterium]
MKNNSYKIVCFGDSTTDATFIPKDAKHQVNYKHLKVFSQILGDELASLLDKKLEVINSGISGDTTEDAKHRFQSDVLDHNPDIVFIQFGANDQSIRQDLGKSTANVSLDSFRENLLYFITELKKTGCKIILMTPGIMLWTDAFKLNYFRAPYRLQEPMGLNGNLKNYIPIICKLALLENIELINIFNKQIAHSQAHNMFDLLPDGIHPNSKGHEFIATIILNHLKI